MITYLIQTFSLNHLKRLFLTALCVFSIFQGMSSAAGTYEDFTKDLNTLGMDTTQIENSPSLSRYELARLLNSVECTDCVVVPQWMQEQYTYQFWDFFTALPGKDFTDISYLGASYQDTSYYYCVAYVGNQNYMRGYPHEVSPICGGKFCGTRNTTYGEFYQVIVNLLGKYIFQDYSANWKDIENWMQGLEKNSYADEYLNEDDRAIITSNASKDQLGPLQKVTDFPVYLKYCMFNLDACGFQEFGKIKQAYWPVAEFNILYQQNIFDQAVLEDSYIYGLVDGKTILENLFKVYDVIQCTFDMDYDKDMRLNNASYTREADSCPYSCNPQQKDTDGDGIGDTCDDDIDGDGIKNPLGIVDDFGNVDISKRVDGMDNCIFVPNTAQVDGNNDNVGDACEDATDQLGIYITADNFAGIAPLSVSFEAITKGVVDYVERNFGDGTSTRGTKVTHTFSTAGKYQVFVKAVGVASGVRADANTTLIVGGEPKDFFGIQIQANELTTSIGGKLTFSARVQGSVDSLTWSIGGVSSDTSPQQSYTHTFEKTGTYLLTAKGFSKGIMVGAASVIVSAGNTKGTLLTATPATISKGTPVVFQTTLKGITSDDIKSIERNFGDGTTQNNSDTLVPYTYTKGGKKVVLQKITFNDDTELTNFLTIYVQDPDTMSSYAAFAIPQYLLQTKNSSIGFTILTVGNTIPTPLLTSYDWNDGVSDMIDAPPSFPKRFVHSYTKSNSYTPTFRGFINECIALESSSTLVIASTDVCLAAVSRGTLSQFKCDMDTDGVPDICDNDIDGDGFTNMLGLILFEYDDCRIDSGNINPEVLAMHQKGLCNLDNCPFTSNPDQRDLNMNYIGDACEVEGYSDLSTIPNALAGDRDGDGILDALDVCPDIPEDYNGIEDTDGCPEIGSSASCDPQLVYGETILDCSDPLNCVPAPITTVNCNSCPCHFSDFSSDLMKDDNVRAMLLDTTRTQVYTFSIPYPVDSFLTE